MNKATRGCDGTVHFFEETESCAEEVRAVALVVPRLFRKEEWVKRKKSGAELFVEGSFVQCGLYDVQQR